MNYFDFFQVESGSDSLMIWPAINRHVSILLASNCTRQLLNPSTVVVIDFVVLGQHCHVDTSCHCNNTSVVLDIVKTVFDSILPDFLGPQWKYYITL